MSGYNAQLNPLALDTLPIVPLVNLRPSLKGAEAVTRPQAKPALLRPVAVEAEPASTAQPRPVAQAVPPQAPESGRPAMPAFNARRLRPLARFSKQEGAPSFYMSLSDLMCLLLVFFVMIFSLTEKGENRVVNTDATPMLAQAAPKVVDPFPQPTPISQGLRKGLLGLMATGQMDPGLTSERQAFAAEPPSQNASFSPQDQDRQNLLGQIRAEASQIPGLEVAVRGQSVLIRLPEVLLFESAQASLNPNLQPTLMRLGQVMRAFPQARVNITGHTDNRPIRTAQYASNWELSGARAAAVARGLVQGGLEPGRITIKGMADQAPLLPNTNDSNRNRNRRVEIELSS